MPHSEGRLLKKVQSQYVVCPLASTPRTYFVTVALDLATLGEVKSHSEFTSANKIQIVKAPIFQIKRAINVETIDFSPPNCHRVNAINFDAGYFITLPI